MPYTGLTKFLLVIGFLSLLHAAYSAAQRKQIELSLQKKNKWYLHYNNNCPIPDRTYLRDTDQEETNSFLPLDVCFINELIQLFYIVLLISKSIFLSTHY